MRVRLFVCVLISCSAAAGRDIHVSNMAGDDRSNGGAARALAPRVGPVRTISKALRLARAADRIIVENTGQPYREALSLVGSRHGGSVLGPLVIEGQGAVLDGSARIPDAQWERVAGEVFAYRPARLGDQQLFLRGRPATRHPARWSDASYPALEPLEWCLWQGRILLRVEAGRMPGDYEPSCCDLQTGMTLYYVDGIVIRDLVVQGFAVDGVAIYDVVQRARLERVECRANARSGVSIRGACWAELEDCQLYDNGRSQLRVADFARLWLSDCELNASSAPVIERLGGWLSIDGKPYAPGDFVSRE